MMEDNTGRMFGHNNCEDSFYVRAMHRIWRHSVSDLKAQFQMLTASQSHTSGR